MVSIIIPVYNAEQTLRRCVNSVLAQTYTNWELILVDDGSTDVSPIICDEYAAKDSRIHVIHKLNGGVSSARNVGVVNAKGKWITFVDSDDWIEKDYIVSFSQGSDLNIQGYYYGDTLIHYETVVIKHNPGAEYLYKKYVYGPYCKLFNIEIIKRNKLQFDETMSYGEDILFLMQYLLYCRTMHVSDKAGYHYILTDKNSLSSRRKTYKQMYEMFVKHVTYFEKNMAGSMYMDYVMRKEIMEMYLCFIYDYGIRYTDIKKDVFLMRCFSSYLHVIDKLIIILFPKQILRYKRRLFKLIE